MAAAIEFLNEIPLAGLMLVVAVGFSIGRLEWRGLSSGHAGGTLFCAIAFGVLGLSFAGLYGGTVPRMTVGGFGFALFIYSIGFEAGPRFFAGFRGGLALRFAAVGVCVNLLALFSALILGRLLGLGESITAGVLSGALTSAPTYAAAEEVCRDGSALAVSFAATYPVGFVGLVLLVQVLPRILRQDLARGSAYDVDDAEHDHEGLETERAFCLTVPATIGKSLRELKVGAEFGCTITRIHRGPNVLIPDAETVVEENDHLLVLGTFAEHQRFEEAFGPEIYDEGLLRNLPAPREIQVTASAAVGKTLAELDLMRRYNCMVVDIIHGSDHIEPGGDTRLARDDIVRVSGERDNVRDVARQLGHFARSHLETDIAIYAAGILLGLLVGQISLAPFGVDIRIGHATGLLAAGVLLGRFRRVGRFSAHVPPPARQLVRDLGILLFIAETGVGAGQEGFAGFREFLAPSLLAAAVVTVVPVLGAVFLARFVLRLRPVDVWGSVSGGLTSSAALTLVRRAADSNEPTVSYTVSYAISSVIAALAGQIIVYLI